MPFDPVSRVPEFSAELTASLFQVKFGLPGPYFVVGLASSLIPACTT